MTLRMANWLVQLASAIAVLLALALDLTSSAAERTAAGTGLGVVSALPGLALAIGAGVVLRRFSRHAVGWVMASGGMLWSIDGLAEAWLPHAVARGSLGTAAVCFWIVARLGAALLLVLPLVIALYPDGRLPTGRWRIPIIASLGLTAVLPLVLVVAPSEVAIDRDGAPPAPGLAAVNLDLTTLPIPHNLALILLQVAFPAAVLGVLVPVIRVLVHYKTADQDRRRRYRWLLWAGVVDVLVMIAGLTLPESVITVGLIVAVTLTTAAVVVGIVNPQFADVDRLLGGTVLYGVLAAVVVVVDLAVLAAAGALLGDQVGERDAVVLAMLVVTAIYLPLRTQLWRLGRRLFFGERGDRYGVLSTLASRLEQTAEPAEQLSSVAAVVADAFRVGFVAIEVDQLSGATMTASTGVRPDRTQEVPIRYRSEQVGRLLLPVQGARSRLSSRDQALLADVVRQAVVTIRNTELAIDLQRSREQLVAAREEERRRIRRDLHDGLGPSLGAIALRLDTARNLLRRQPDRVDELLSATRDEVTGTIADVRRLVHDLRPPTLDDLGLLGSLRQLAARLSTPTLTIRVAGTDSQTLPAAVEVAAYRIVSEALTNVVRHAQATTCGVELTVAASKLQISVTDDGVGIGAGQPAGVGLVSMRERAAELGGRVEVSCPEPRGSKVSGWLPLVGAV